MSETESSGVGVVTAVEDVDGSMVEMSSVDGDKRKEWISAIEKTLEDLDGVESVSGGGFAHQNFQRASYEIMLSHTPPKWGEKGVDIEANLRSLGQLIPNKINEKAYVSTCWIEESPDAIGNGRHRDPVYIIEVRFR